MDFKSDRLLGLLPAWLAVAVLCIVAAPAGAVVVAGGDNGWEVSFDGNVNGFWVYEDTDAAPASEHNLRFNYVVDPDLPTTSGAVQGLGPRLELGPRLVSGLGNIIGGVLMAGEQIVGAVVSGGVSLLEGGIMLVSGALSFLDAPLPENHPNRCVDPDLTDDEDQCHLTINVKSRLSGGTLSDNARASRVRTGLLPAFFSFNVRSPEVNGLRGSARISFAPQIQNANTKNQFGAQVDLREVFFNVDGDFGTFSVGRTLSLFQRHSILNDMTLFGVGVQGGVAGGGTTLGRIGYGYVYPQFNARISYKTPNVNGFQMEVGMYDPSRICHTNVNVVADDKKVCASTTKIPRFETEITYASEYDHGTVLGWFGAMWQEAENFDPVNAGEIENPNITAWGINGGMRVAYQGFSLTATGYTGEALGSVLMLDTDSVDRHGYERDNHGWFVQGTYSAGKLTLGVSYGENNADETATESDILRHLRATTNLHTQIAGVFRNLDNCDPAAGHVSLNGRISQACADALADVPAADRNLAVTVPVPIKTLSSLTFGAYYDVNSWFKLVAEYTRVENDWHNWDGGLVNGFEMESDIFSVGSFFTW